MLRSISRLPTWLLRLYDFAAIVLSGILALAMRMDGTLPELYLRNWFLAVLASLPVTLFIYRWCGMYTRLWRYASAGDLIQIAKAVSLQTATVAGMNYILSIDYPRGALVIAWLTLLALIGGIRYAMKIANERELGISTASGGEPTLVLGAGSAGQQLVRELTRHTELGFRLIGFLDDDSNKLGMSIHGYKVLGTLDDLELIAHNFGIKRIILALPSVEGGLIRKVSARGASLGLTVQTVPSLFEVVEGSVYVAPVRPVQLDDLLRRPSVQLDKTAIGEMVKGKTVLITGAGGSIGSEITRQVLSFHPERVLLLGRGENSIYQILEELNDRYPQQTTELIPIICDVRRRDLLEQVFSIYRPQLVFHAAAHKHVPMMEIYPREALENNVFGTQNVAELALQYESERFVMISTDKAVAPANAMGASKRAAELIIDSLAEHGTTKFMVVRFGNVLGSRGSAPLRFQRQIAAGGPVTLTDERMTRYFMTIPEAVQLVLQAGAMGQGSELFILDMGEPVKMLDLIHDLIRLSGLEPNRDIEIKITGSRPGEKLYEELLTPEEGTIASKHEKITVVRRNSPSPDQLQALIDRLHALCMQDTLTSSEVVSTVTDVLNIISISRTQDVTK